MRKGIEDPVRRLTVVPHSKPECPAASVIFVVSLRLALEKPSVS
jgi:hypothetical protein